MKSLMASMKSLKGVWDKGTGKVHGQSWVSEECAGAEGEAPVLGSVSDGRVIILPSDVKGRRPHLL